jgi:spermidine synthase
MARVLFLIFFLSGAAALTFETIWFRLAGLALGNTVWAAALVMSGFMGGLALGNALVASQGHRIASPLKFYAFMELLIGVTGFSLILLLPFLSQGLAPLFQQLSGQPWLLNSTRLFLAFALMLVPTTAMGVTLPLLVKELSRINPNFGAVLGRLYGWNTVGAMFGVLIAELLLIRYLGLRGAGLCAAMFNFIGALVALRMAASYHDKPAAAAGGGRFSAGLSLGTLSPTSLRLLCAASLAGAIMLALEVVWFRFLLLFASGTSLVFALMLTIVLAGIGCGGLLAAGWYRRSARAHHGLRELMLLAGITTVLTYWSFERIFYLAVQGISNESIFTFLAFASFLMLPISMISGALFTLLGHAARDNLDTETRTAGLLTLANTLGAMLGALVGGFVLLPKLGMENAFLVLAIGYGLNAMIVPGQYRPQSPVVRYAALAVFVLSCLFFPFGHMQESILTAVDQRYVGGKRVAVREGLTETAIMYRFDRYDQPSYYRLATNGMSMSGTRVQAKRYMKLYVYWPVALHPNPESALLISYGVGSTAKALSDTQSLQSIDVVDISREILSLSDVIYTDPSEHPLRDERVQVHIEDGRFFLQTTDRRYDLITSEPPPPKLAGIVNLYTQDYFELIRSRLAEGGMTTYWLPVHDLYERDSLAIIKSFCNAFADCSLWSGAGLDWMLVGTRNATGPVSAEHFRKQWEDEVVGAELRALGLEQPAQLGALFMADAQELQRLTQDTLPVTDNFPGRLTDELVPDVRTSRFYGLLMDTDRAREAFARSSLVSALWPRELRSESLGFFHYERLVTEHFAPQYRRENAYFWEDLKLTLTQTSLSTLPLWMLGSSQWEQEILAGFDANTAPSRNTMALKSLGAIARRDYGAAVELLRGYAEVPRQAELSNHQKLFLFALAMDGRWDEALQSAGKFSTEPHGESDARYWDWMRRTFDAEGLSGAANQPADM